MFRDNAVWSLCSGGGVEDPLASIISNGGPAVIESSLDNSTVRSTTAPQPGLLVCLETGDVYCWLAGRGAMRL